jgi:hypothetical protein
MGGSVFILPQAALSEPKGQASLVNLLFGMLFLALCLWAFLAVHARFRPCDPGAPMPCPTGWSIP